MGKRNWRREQAPKKKRPQLRAKVQVTAHAKWVCALTACLYTPHLPLPADGDLEDLNPRLLRDSIDRLEACPLTRAARRHLNTARYLLDYAPASTSN